MLPEPIPNISKEVEQSCRCSLFWILNFIADINFTKAKQAIENSSKKKVIKSEDKGGKCSFLEHEYLCITGFYWI